MSVQGSMHIHEDEIENTSVEVEYKSEFDSPTGREYFILTIETPDGLLRGFLPPEVMDMVEDHVIGAQMERAAIVDGPDSYPVGDGVTTEQDPYYRAAMQDAGRGRQLP